MSDAPSSSTATAGAEEYQTAQTALVSSLCELSTAATQTATAALNFYKFAGSDNADAKLISASLKTLSEAVLAASKNGFASVSNGRAIAKPVKRKETAAASIPERIAGPHISSDHSESAPSTADLDALATTDPALVKASAPEKTRKKRAEKDPNAPKKPLTLYLRFNLAVREQLSGERKESGQPTLQATELNRIISERWATVPADAKLELQKAYEADYEVYKKDLEAYKLKKLAQDTRAAEDAAGPVAVAVPVSSPVAAPAPAPTPAQVAAAAATKPAAPAAETPSKAPKSAAPAAETPSKAPKSAAPAAETPSKATKAPAPAAETSKVTKAPAPTGEKPKKKKKAAKKAASAAAAPNTTTSETTDLAAVAAEVAKEAIAAEAAQAQAKPSKKRKEKDSGEKASKKKKTQSEAPPA